MELPPAPATVLVADESAIGRTWAERLLSEAGHRVLTARDGRDALAVALEHDPDVVVADEALRPAGGRQVVRALRRDRPDAGVVVLTARGGGDAEADARRLGVDELVRKPCTAAALAGAVESARVAGRARRERREREDHNAGEMAAAAAIQAALLPRPPAVPGGWAVDAACAPARMVGGDVYDLLRPDPGTLVAIVADVSGTGVAGALLGAMFRTAVRAALGRGEDVAAALGSAGALLYEDLADAGRFLTAVAAEIHLAGGRVRYADAGHGHHLLLGAHGAPRALPAGGAPIGFLPVPDVPLGEERLRRGETLALYSDGLVEDGGAGDPVAAREELAAALAAGRASGELVAAAGDDDDRTLVAIRRAA
jgi:serine phosphatase RsbU (regulator of sigma subunit)